VEKTQKIDTLAHVSQHSVAKGLRIQLRSERPRPKKHPQHTRPPTKCSILRNQLNPWT